jgi:hypothetical protein
MQYCEWQDESTCMGMCIWVYLLTQCISNCQCIWADSARVGWSKAVQASSVQAPKIWGSVWSRSKNFLDWTWTRLDGSSLDWSIAGLVESLPIPAFGWDCRHIVNIFLTWINYNWLWCNKFHSTCLHTRKVYI